MTVLKFLMPVGYGPFWQNKSQQFGFHTRNMSRLRADLEKTYLTVGVDIAQWLYSVHILSVNSISVANK